MADKIDINSAPVKMLVQLPGVSIDIAYGIIDYRQRHGFFTSLEELKLVHHFPAEKLNAVRERAVLIQPAEGRSNETVPISRTAQKRIEKSDKRTEGYTKKMRSTRRPERLRDSHDHSHHDGEGRKSA